MTWFAFFIGMASGIPIGMFLTAIFSVSDKR